MNKTYTLITGASRGIGKELAVQAARDGHNLILVARDQQALTILASDLVKRYNILVEVFALDLSISSSSQQLFDLVKRKRLSVDTLINNAGFGDYGLFAQSDLPTQLGMIDLNIRTLTELTHRFLPELKTHDQAYIMNLGSIASYLPGPLMSVYFASKAYVLSFSEALSEELRDTNISVTCLCPGSTNTNFGDVANVNKTHSTRTSRVTAQRVAQFGWGAMRAKKNVAIYGIGNRLSIAITRWLPRSIVARIIRNIQT